MQESYSIISISPNLIQLEVTDLAAFASDDDNKFSIGSYLKITDGNDLSVIAIVKSYRIKDPTPTHPMSEPGAARSFVVDSQPVGLIENGKFKRGGKQITIPPTSVEIAGKDVFEQIYSKQDDATCFEIGALSMNPEIRVPIDGDKFFSKHVAVLGSTGSGKSCTVVKILHESMKPDDEQSKSGTLNNSHIVLFDLHGEYSSAFETANMIDVDSLALPYWLMNGEELEEIFIESNEANSHNQISQFRHAVIENKKRYNQKMTDLTYDTPVYFSINEVHNYIQNLNKEVIGKAPGEGLPKLLDGTLVKCREDYYFDKTQEFVPTNNSAATKANVGPFSGDFDRFVRRLETKLNDDRLKFLLRPLKDDGTEYLTSDLDTLLQSFIGYKPGHRSNMTIINLAGIPFEETSIVVSLVSRLLFEFSFYFKALSRVEGTTESDVPILVVYEEAHKYVPNSQLARYSSARTSIERIAKEGRKYGISLMIVSQRPSEISDTIFAQCNNFVVMRLTNPADQNYVARLLPDTISNVTDNLPALEQREAILIGDAVNIPSVVVVDDVDPKPKSEDVGVLTEWRKDWYEVAFADLTKRVQRQ